MCALKSVNIDVQVLDYDLVMLSHAKTVSRPDSACTLHILDLDLAKYSVTHLIHVAAVSARAEDDRTEGGRT